MKTIQLILLALVLSLSVVAQDQIINGALTINPKDAYTSGWRIAYLHHAHSLIVGSPLYAYSHNTLELKPGGCTNAELYASMQIYRSPAPNLHVEEIRLTANRNGVNFINSGNVGIGTENPQALLDVRGKIIADEVEIKVNTGADFVFAEDYTLKPLAEVAVFVKENKHLPEIPSEKEMQENGLNVNEFQIKLLQKIEELTLYVIEQDKKYGELKKENKQLEERVEDMEKQLQK